VVTAVGETLNLARSFTACSRGPCDARYYQQDSSPFRALIPMMNRERYVAGQRYDAMVGAAQKLVDLWTITRRRATVDDAAVAAVEATGVPLHLLVLSADWCIDAACSIPFIDALAERGTNLDLRILDRDKNLDLIDAHLTNGKSRSIPVVIVYDDQFVERGWWGPRPAELQALVQGAWATLETSERVAQERRWYVKDRGVSSVREIVALLERAAAATSASAPSAMENDATPAA